MRDGGVRRTYALIERFGGLVPTVLIDRRPTPVSARPGLRVVEYSVPSWVARLEQRAHFTGGVADVALVTVQLLRLGWREVRRARAPIVYVPNSELPWLTVAAYLLSRMLHRRVALVNLNTKGTPGGAFGRWLNWRLHSRADVLIALSEATRAELEAVGVRRPMETNGCGFDGPPSSVADVREPLRWSAVFIGRLQPEKGIADLLEVWARVVARLPSSDLLLLGFATPAQRKRVLSRVAELGLADRVHLGGTVTESAKWEALGHCRVCLFLSHVEGWGLVPVEALSIGVPTVVYELPCYRESLRGLTGVFAVPIGDIEGAARKVVELLCQSESEGSDLRTRIRSAFRYRSWQDVAVRELSLMGLLGE